MQPIGLSSSRVRRPDGRLRTRRNSFVAVLAREGCRAPSRRAVEIQRIEFIGLWRRDRKVGIGPTPRRAQDFIENGLALPVDRYAAPYLDGSLAKIARIEKQGIFPRQAAPAITAEFKPECSAFERVDAFA